MTVTPICDAFISSTQSDSAVNEPCPPSRSGFLHSPRSAACCASSFESASTFLAASLARSYPLDSSYTYLSRVVDISVIVTRIGTCFTFLVNLWSKRLLPRVPASLPMIKTIHAKERPHPSGSLDLGFLEP